MIRLPSTIPSCCHPPCQLQSCSRLSSNCSSPNYALHLHPSPAANPRAISRPPAGRQATPPPRYNPTLYSSHQPPLTLSFSTSRSSPSFSSAPIHSHPRHPHSAATSPAIYSPSPSSPSCSSAPTFSHALQSPPAATPPASYSPADVHRATPPPQSTPSIYILLLLPTPMPSPALQQLAKQLHPLDIIPPSTTLTSSHSPCYFPPPTPRQAIPRHQSTPTHDIPILLPPPLPSTVLPRVHQAAPPPQYFPTLYNPLLLPPPCQLQSCSR